MLVDTCVWSLALRRDGTPGVSAVQTLRQALLGGQTVVVTGIILAELLRGAVREDSRQRILQSFQSLTYLEPTWGDYVLSAGLANTCRAKGVQLATVDSVLAALAISNNLALLTTDQDFVHASRFIPLTVIPPGASGQTRHSKA